MSRTVVLDTETTGIDTSQGHRIIEIGCVEVVDRKLTGNHYHAYVNPCRAVDEAAFAVHGLSDDFLSDKPVFKQVASEFLEFIRGAELVIHNAPFDVGFINHEFKLLPKPFDKVETYCQITDSLVYARKKHIGQKNSLDILCRRYDVDNSGRTFHGALLDAELLAEVYLRMTGGQTSMLLGGNENKQEERALVSHAFVDKERSPLKVVRASTEELLCHEEKLTAIAKVSGKSSVWEQIKNESVVQ